MIQLNKFGLCASQYLGTGRGQCPITDFGDLKGIGLLRKGTKLTVATDTLNETTFRALITDGKLHQLVGSFGFEDTTPENATEESTDGVMQVVRDGKPMYNMTFKRVMRTIRRYILLKVLRTGIFYSISQRVYF